jgi:hypothetical protein
VAPVSVVGDSYCRSLHDACNALRMFCKMLEKYSRCGVKYVEFSIGWSDVVECSWVYHQLVGPGVIDRKPVNDFGVAYNFLAGFGRNEVVFNKKSRKDDGYAHS